MLDLETIRREYLMGGLRRGNLADDPLRSIRALDERRHQQPHSTPLPCLATVDANHRPHQRLVLLKKSSAQGLVFFTNLSSAKAHIAANQFVSLHFPLAHDGRQVRVEGRAEKLTTAEAHSFFLSRPTESQLAAWASPQSQRISSRSLLQQFNAMKEKFQQGAIPLPDF